MVSELDRAIGRLVDALEAEGILDQTLIWFMSDKRPRVFSTRR
jgi:arylsulfatase A-like enzyme